MMRNGLGIYLSFCLLLIAGNLDLKAQKTNGYVVLASEQVKEDKTWNEVVSVLAGYHRATVMYYRKHPNELLEALRKLTPRYVACVEKPENLSREYVMEGHRLSRIIDDDIYADYLWGIITGYTADEALQLVKRSQKPYVVKTALNTTCEMSQGKWFDRFAYMSDCGMPGEWGEKKAPGKEVGRFQISKWEILDKWVEKYKEIDPDLLITSSHATEKNLEMPFSVGNLKAKDGKLYADFMTPEFLGGTRHPRVYFAAGNCLIGNIDNDPQSMAVGWLSGMDATAMVGYVVTTWYGRNGWGGLKYWVANAGRLTLAQAVYLNQQDMLRTEYEWNPAMLKIGYPFSNFEFGEREQLEKDFEAVTGVKPTTDQVGFIHDRDVLAFYGDPAWEVRLQQAEPHGYDVGFRRKGKKCVVTITTHENFDEGLMRGGKLKQEHVSDIPFAYYFPEKIDNPRLAPGQNWEVAVAEDFLLVYNCDFVKNKSYTIVLETDGTRRTNAEEGKE